MPRKGKCVRCSHDLFECNLKEVKNLPCKHYCHSLFIVSLHEEEEEEKACGHSIHSHWLRTTMDDIKEQQRIDEGVDYQEFYSSFSLTALDTIDDHFKQLQSSISCRGMINHSIEFRNFAEYMDMLQKTFTLV